MTYSVSCECGWGAKGTKEELIPLVQQHAREVHSMEVTPDQVVPQLKPVDA